jgi:hypothetical protein
MPDQSCTCRFPNVANISTCVRAGGWSKPGLTLSTTCQRITRWLKEIYFVEKFPAYQRYRAKRIGAPTEQLSTKDVRTQLLLARSGMAQLSLWTFAIA